VASGHPGATFQFYDINNPAANPFGGPDNPPTVYQMMNVFVPVEISLDDYEANLTPIFFPNSIGCYVPVPPRHQQS
jgi:hypothetical protein